MKPPLFRILLPLLLCSPVSAAPYFVHCYDFGCKSWMELHYGDEQWRTIRAIMQRGNIDAGAEKQAIRRAVAAMERFSGAIAGTDLDKAGNYPGSDLPGQMDCIDESTNTFQYLSALDELGLLKYHRVDIKQRRMVWFITHWTATISELDGGRRFAVDSWYRDNGELPYIQPIEDWQRKRDFPADYNPELAAAGEP